MSFRHFRVPYTLDDQYSKRVAYFSMEFAIHQPLKIYSGGLGFLAGSHLRSAYELKQSLIGIGILWKYGYYEQERNRDGTMKVNFIEKNYQIIFFYYSREKWSRRKMNKSFISEHFSTSVVQW